MKYHSVLISYYHLEVTYKENISLAKELQRIQLLTVEKIVENTIKNSLVKFGFT